MELTKDRENLFDSSVNVENKSARTEATKQVEKQTKQLEQILMENLSCEMFHFILNVFYSPHLVLKIIILLFILIASGLASFTTITLILSYLEYNVITITRTINETPVTFPKVTICNRNMFTTQYAYSFLSQTNQINSTLFKNLILNDNRREALATLNGINLKLTGAINNSPDDVKKKLGHDLNDTLLSCAFDYESCDSNSFQWEWDSNYGNCFSFNTGYNSTGH